MGSLISVIVPVYNAAPYLGRCLDSILGGTHEELEVILVDDGSPDQCPQLCDEWAQRDQRILVIHKTNGGLSDARNAGIEKATGDYITFVDSDDWIEPDTVEQMVNVTKDGTIDIVGCDFMKDFLSGKTTYHHEKYAETCRENMYRCLNYDIATVLWKLLLRRSLFENISITPHVDIVEDYIISVKLYYYAKSFVALPKAFYHYVQYNQARVSLQTLWSVNMHIRGVQEVEEFLREKDLYDGNVEHKLMLRKFNIKSNFLTKQLLDYQSYKGTFPEANGIWREMNYSRNERIKFWLAEHGFYSLLKAIQR